MQIMTFNLRIKTGTDNTNSWNKRVEKIAKLIKKYSPEIIGTQEGTLEMLKDLENNLDEYVWLGEGRFGGSKGEYCAIFYKKSDIDLIGNGQFWLSKTPDIPGSKNWDSAFPRVCTWGHFQLENKKDFMCLNTHLDHESEEARVKGIQLINEFFSERLEQKPGILMGDLNAEPDSDEIKEIKLNTDLINSYQHLEGKQGATYHNFSGKIEGKPIDYIFTTPEININKSYIIIDFFKNEAIEKLYPSDHYPVMAEVEI